MKTRRLGPDGPEVSVLGIGAMSFTDMYGKATDAQAHAILDAALEAGVTHVDTANIYGRGVSEERIGAWLARYGKASPFRIATKAGIDLGDPPPPRRSLPARAANRAAITLGLRPAPNYVRSFNNAAAYLEAELDGSLRRLGVERVDLFYVHRRDPKIEIEEVTATLAGLIARGKIAAFGYSEIAPSSLRRAAAVHPVAAVQSEYSLSTRLPELGLVQACEDLGTALVAFSPLGRGLLTDAPPDADRANAPGFLRGNPRFSGGNLGRNLAAAGALREMAAARGLPTAALALAWILHKSPVTHVIPGTRSPAHFAELVQGATLALDADDMAEIERRLPVGWAHGSRYKPAEWQSVEIYG